MNNLFIKKQFAEIKEIPDLAYENEDMLRIWCNLTPDSFTFQIRTFKPITQWGKGKSRNMMANVNLTITEVEEILEFMKAQHPESKLRDRTPLQLYKKEDLDKRPIQ